MLALVVLALAACGGNGEGAKLATQVVPTTSASATSVARVAASSPTINPQPGATIGPGLIVGTPRPGESTAKDQPAETQSAGAPPTEAAAPLPTVPPNLDADGDGFYTFAELEQAVAALYPTYVWPSNYRIDPNAILATFGQAKARGDVFEVRAEYTLIGVRHNCAWEMTWLDGFRAGDAGLMKQSIDQLLWEAQIDPMMEESYRSYFRGVIKSARLGDPAPMQQAVSAGGCSSIVFITPAPASSSSTPPT